MNSWITQLAPIIEEFAGGKKALNEESLDGDQIESLCNIIKLKIRLNQGNITQREYEKGMDSPNHIDLATDSESESGLYKSAAHRGDIKGNPNNFQDALIDIDAERYLMYDYDADCYWILLNIDNGKEVGILKRFGVIDNIEAFKRQNFDFIMLLVDEDSTFRSEN